MRRSFLIGATALLLTPSLSAAQEVGPTCDVISTVWAGGSEATSDLSVTPFPIDLSEPIGGSTPSGFAFRVSSPTDIRLEAVAPSIGGDPVISLLDASGAEIGFDDDSGGGFNSRLEVSLSSGSYCLAVSAFAGETFTADLRLGRLEHDAITVDAQLIEDPTCRPETPAMMLARAPLNQRLSEGPVREAIRPDEVPFLRFTLSTDQALTLVAKNQAADPVLRLFDSDGIELAQNDDFDGLNARIDLPDALPAGEYCISLSALSDPSLPVEVTVAAFDEEAFLVALYEQGETPPPLDGSYPVDALGILETVVQKSYRVGPRAEWIAFEMPEAGLALISAISLTDGDPRLILFDEFGREIAQNDDSGTDLNAEIPARVGRGTYLIALTEVGAEDSSNRTRLVIERYMPAH
jgi:hypothetical protein